MSDDCNCRTICMAGFEGGEARCPRAPRLVDLATREPIEVKPSPSTRAVELVNGDRQSDYGHPLDNHERIAAFWTVRLADKLKPGCVVEPHDAAALMRLAKESRLMQTIGHYDSQVDIAGYADVEHAIHEGYATRPDSFLSRLFGFRRDRAAA